MLQGNNPQLPNTPPLHSTFGPPSRGRRRERARASERARARERARGRARERPSLVSQNPFQKKGEFWGSNPPSRGSRRTLKKRDFHNISVLSIPSAFYFPLQVRVSDPSSRSEVISAFQRLSMLSCQFAQSSST